MKEKGSVLLVSLEEVERLLLLVTRHPTFDDWEEVVLVHWQLLVCLLHPTIIIIIITTTTTTQTTTIDQSIRDVS
jgi:hypothetical protein